ncbi:response regulator transcription factor [Amycolatopsis anabasis]|uniref:response regulator transcription factor n=1 Tax=Amycolatopsis anabasis TaxID=1840409 RepID=UPI00131E2696|nr:response regulator transcription factor [Amycolatopsis anabasis]
MIRVLLCAGHELVRAGLAALLGSERDITVVSQVGEGPAVITEVDRLRPDVMIMDIQPRNEERAQVMRVLANGRPEPIVPVIALTNDIEVATLLTALSLGARGLVYVDDTQEHIVNAVRAVADGLAFVTPVITAPLLDELSRHVLVPATGNGELSKLTNRELSVLRSLAAGRTTAEIARDLHVTKATVKSHVSHLLLKLQLTERVQAVVVAYQSGLVDPTTLPRPRRPTP